MKMKVFFAKAKWSFYKLKVCFEMKLTFKEKLKVLDIIETIKEEEGLDLKEEWWIKQNIC